MKKQLTLLITLFAVTAMAQDTTKIIKKTDDMTGKVSYRVSKSVALFHETEPIGFAFFPVISTELSVYTIYVNTYGLGNCNEKNTLIIQFENESIITLNSWSEFNCEKYSYFTVTKKDLSLLAENKIKKVRYINGRTHDKLTVEVSEDERDYMVNILKLLKTKTFSEK